jgi:hypothetical protein
MFLRRAKIHDNDSQGSGSSPAVYNSMLILCYSVATEVPTELILMDIMKFFDSGAI